VAVLISHITGIAGVLVCQSVPYGPQTRKLKIAERLKLV